MEPESHALWNNRDIITAIMKCTHPEIHNSDKRALCLTSKLLKVCTNEAAKQNAYTLLSPVLNGLRPGIQAYEIEKLIENCMSYTMLCSAEVSPGYGREHEPHGAAFTRVALVLRSEDWSHAVKKMRYGRLESKCAEIRRLCM